MGKLINYRFRIYLVLVLFYSYTSLKAQSYEPLQYSFNGTPTYGVKIRTNIPYCNGCQMPTLRFEGYNYGDNTNIGLLLTWYIYNDAFYHKSLSSYGSHTPKIFLSNENGKVVIFLDDRGYYQRFKVSVFALGMGEGHTWFQGWTTSDEILTGTNTVEVPYQNAFSGKVGIGTTSPNSKLHISGATPFVRINSDTYDTPHGIKISYNNFDNHGLHLSYYANSALGYIDNTYITTSGTPYGDIHFRQNVSGNMLTRMHIKADGGNIGIGTTNPTERLSVNGNIRAKKLIISQQNWSDYVFYKNYKLRPINELEKFIQKYQHLPDVPSTKEVQSKGINVGDTQALLLKKIEELTLYVIKQDKKINEMSKKITFLEKK